MEIITWLDDHSRYALAVTAHRRITEPIVLATFRETVAQHGIPVSTLTDNGMVHTTRLAGGKGGRSGLETELRRLNITQKNSRPNHPTTCGKVERSQQTMKSRVGDFESALAAVEAVLFADLDAGEIATLGGLLARVRTQVDESSCIEG